MLKILDLVESKEMHSSEMAAVIGGWGMRYEGEGDQPEYYQILPQWAPGSTNRARIMPKRIGARGRFHPSRVSGQQKLIRQMEADAEADRKKVGRKRSLKPIDLSKSDWSRRGC